MRSVTKGRKGDGEKEWRQKRKKKKRESGGSSDLHTTSSTIRLRVSTVGADWSGDVVRGGKWVAEGGRTGRREEKKDKQNKPKISRVKKKREKEEEKKTTHHLSTL